MEPYSDSLYEDLFNSKELDTYQRPPMYVQTIVLAVMPLWVITLTFQSPNTASCLAICYRSARNKCDPERKGGGQTPRFKIGMGVVR